MQHWSPMKYVLALTGTLLLSGLIGCKPAARQDSEDQPGMIKIDGSSTVFPIAEAVAEEFQLSGRRVRVTVGLSGTGGGFKKLCRGEIDVTNASRPILTEEMAKCRQAGVRYLELPVAFDAITVVVNPTNSWVKTLTLQELKQMWEPAAQDKIKRWNQIRPDWPDAPLTLFGPGADSGTFDYFTEAVCGKAKSSRGDFTASEDDNVLVQGVQHNANALGYFGFAYYNSHRQQMRAVPIDNGSAAVLPSIDSVNDGSYRPLSRPLFIYVNEAAVARPEVRDFVEFYLANSTRLAEETGFIGLPQNAIQKTVQLFRERRAGTVFAGVPQVGMTIDELLNREAAL
jgi:phosphate transport system substrate-binding protein